MNRLLDITHAQVEEQLFYACDDGLMLRVNVAAFKRAQEPDHEHGH